MHRYAKEVWLDTIARLEAESIELGSLCSEVFAGYCESAALIREAGEIINEDGMIIAGGKDGVKKHPAVTIKTQAIAALRIYASELGLTPSSKSRVQSAKSTEPNPFDEF